jgi:hypothetical protein
MFVTGTPSVSVVVCAVAPSAWVLAMTCQVQPVPREPVGPEGPAARRAGVGTGSDIDPKDRGAQGDIYDRYSDPQRAAGGAGFRLHCFMHMGKLIEHGSTDTIFTNPSKTMAADYTAGRYV